MTLTAGTRVGPYEIVALLGAGGMGEVYRARDRKLERDVAIKVLPELFVSDPERVARFQREAKTLAALNHPHIAQIYGLEGQEGRDGQDATAFIVMELVDGADLAQRIAQGPIPVDEALPIARQIAEALEAAHEAGIIHRDLKPANIKLRPDSTVKVLDFGLAKALEPMSGASASVTASPTITTPAMMTGIGVILGTAAYMSPEQAKGRPADKRSDIWAFGAVLYEMLSGARAFKGEDVSDTLAAVLRQEVDWTALTEATPGVLRRLIARCLDRDPKRRLRDIGEARIALDDPAARDTTAGHSSTTDRPIPSTRPLWLRTIPFVLTAIAAAAFAGAIAWISRPSAPQVVSRFTLTIADGQTFASPGRQMLGVSGDGTELVYTALPGRLYRRSMSDLDAKPIQGLEAQQTVTSPVLSPDGLSVAFFTSADSTLKKIAVAGGTAVTLCPADNPYGMSWDDDAIVFGQGTKGVMRVSANGGAPEVLVKAKDGEVMHGPQLLPGRQAVLFTLATSEAGTDRWDKANIVVQSLTTGERRTLIQGGSDARYVPTGHLLFAISGTVFGVPFDVRRLEVKGGPVPLIAGVKRASGALGAPVTGAANFSVSRTGSLVYIPGPVSASMDQLDIVLADGASVKRLKLPPAPYSAPRASPDGQRIAFGTDDGTNTSASVWVYDLSEATTLKRLTFAGHNRFPIWTADGKRVVFQSDREGDLGIFATSADGGGTVERLTKAEPGTAHVPESWSPTGDVFAFSIVAESSQSLWTWSAKSRKATPVDGVRSSTPIGAAFSPDGRWIAYTSTEQRRATVYVRPFPTTDAKYQLFTKDTDQPHHPAWSPSGNAIFYAPGPRGLESVGVTTKPTFAFGNPVAVPRTFNTGAPSVRRLYDVTPDGKFVGLMPAGQTDSSGATAQTIQIVLNWFEELKARVPLR